MSTEHTCLASLCWSTDKDNVYLGATTTTGDFYLVAHRLILQDAKDIVRACNNFDGLLDACKLAKRWLGLSVCQEALQYEDDFETVLPAIEAAIIAATEKTGK